MKRASTEILYFETGATNAPTLWVNDGEEFEVETQINAGPWLDGHADEEALRRKLRGGNPSSGCVYIEGAEPGQMLTVHVGDIELAEVAFLLGFSDQSAFSRAFKRWTGNPPSLVRKSG